MLFYLAYISIISLLLVLNFFLTNKYNVFEILALITIILVSGLRDYTGYDFKSYSDSYQSKSFDDSFEPGFTLLMQSLRFIGANYHVMFFLVSLATYTILYFGLKKYTIHSGIALIVFMLIPGLYLNSLSIIRQELAIAISFFAFSFLTERKFLIYFLLMVLGISFHYSCGLIIFFHIIIWKFADKLKLWHYFIGIVISLIIAKLELTNFLTLVLGGGKYESYIEGESVNFLKLIVLNGFLIIQLLFYDKLIAKNDMNKYTMAFVVFGILILNTFSSLLILTRLAYYLRIFEIVLIAEFIYLFSKRLKIIVLFIVYLYYLAMFTSGLKNDIDAEDFGPKMIPYKSVFD